MNTLRLVVILGAGPWPRELLWNGEFLSCPHHLPGVGPIHAEGTVHPGDHSQQRQNGLEGPGLHCVPGTQLEFIQWLIFSLLSCSWNPGMVLTSLGTAWAQERQAPLTLESKMGVPEGLDSKTVYSLVI